MLTRTIIAALSGDILPTAAALLFWSGETVSSRHTSAMLPIAIASVFASARRVYGRLSRLDCHALPATTLRKVVAPIPSGQTGLDVSRQAQFSASIVIFM
jgi:hypothetical protein